MIQVLSRSRLFHTVPVADQMIARYQQSYASDLDPADRQQAALLRRYYDHCAPFRELELKAEGVLAFPAGDKRSYYSGVPAALAGLLLELGVEQVALSDFLNNDLMDFEFRSFSARNGFRALSGRRRSVGALLLSRDALPRVLPLFFEARRWDIPVFLLYSASGTPLSIHFCDDGNLHFTCASEEQERLISAAAGQGFETGDIELCTTRSIAYLR